MSCCDGRYSTTSCRCTVRLGDDDSSKVSRLFECTSLCLCRLTDGCIQYHDSLIRLDYILNLYHFIEQVLLLPVSPRCINNDNLEALFLEFLHTLACDNDWICLCVTAVI